SYCAGCHSDRAKAGGLSLQGLNPEDPGAAPEGWGKVVRKLRVRYMPPAGAPAPARRAPPQGRVVHAVVAGVEPLLDPAPAPKPNPGRTDTFRRLSRTEYHNA